MNLTWSWRRCMFGFDHGHHYNWVFFLGWELSWRHQRLFKHE